MFHSAIAEPHVSGHAARASAHRDAADRSGDEAHESVVEGEQPDADPAVGEQPVVLLGRRDDGVPQGQRGLRRSEHQRPAEEKRPGEHRHREGRQSKPGRAYAAYGGVFV